jgi:hypothetical protein
MKLSKEFKNGLTIEIELKGENFMKLFHIMIIGILGISTCGVARHRSGLSK